MLGSVDRHGSLFGVELFLDGLFEGDDSSFYARMAVHGSALIQDEDFADCYSATMGRPSIPPEIPIRALISVGPTPL